MIDIANQFENYKNKFANDIFYDKEKITYEEYHKLLKEDRSMCICETFVGESSYYRKIPLELTDEQLKTVILIETYKLNKDTNDKVNTMKSILVFWLVISIIALAIPLIFAR